MSVNAKSGAVWPGVWASAVAVVNAATSVNVRINGMGMAVTSEIRNMLRSYRGKRIVEDPFAQDLREQQRFAAGPVQHGDRHAVPAQRGERARDRRIAPRPVGAHQRDVALGKRRA